MSLRKEDCPPQPMSPAFAHVKEEEIMNPITEFGMLLYVIASKLSREQTKAVVYLIQDIITRREAEGIQDAVNAFKLLRHRNCIHYTRPEFLYIILQDVGRYDLCELVREYERNVARIPSLLKTSGDHHGQKLEKQFRRKYYSRVRLKRLADQLTRNDLESMLAICKGFYPVSYQEKIESPLDLFYTLEEYGFLSPEDPSFLEKLLESKKHLLKNFKPSARKLGCEVAAQTTSSATQCQNHPNPKVGPSDFQLLLVHIGESLSNQEVEHLKTFQPWWTSATNGVVTGPQLMVHWQELGLVSALEMTFLRKALRTIGQQSLCQKLSTHLQDSARHIGEQGLSI